LTDIRKFLTDIGPINRSFFRTLSIDFCRPVGNQGHFAGLEYAFYQINMPEDSNLTPEELRDSLKRTERHIKNDILDTLRLLSGAGKQNLNDLSLMIPGDDQGRLMLYRYENDFYYRGDLLEDDEMRTAIRDMGPVEKLSIARTESKELAMSLAREMEVKELSVKWVRAYFEQEEEDPRWNTDGWVQDEDFLGAKIDLTAAQ
jgi:hypothetical protein